MNIRRRTYLITVAITAFDGCVSGPAGSKQDPTAGTS